MLRYVVILFLGWRMALLFVTFLGLGALPTINHQTKELFPPGIPADYWQRWANWDGKVYQGIATEGYEPVQTVFFPAYSILIKWLTLIGIPAFLSGFLISQICTFLAMLYLYKLVLLDFSDKVARRAIFALLIFPTGFYLVSLYNESLTLFMAIAAVYYARKKNWRAAAILAGIASVTRLTGIAVVVAVFAEYLLKESKLSIPGFRISSLGETITRRLFLYLLIALAVLNLIKSVFSSNQNLILIGVIVSVLKVAEWALIFVGMLLLLQPARILIKHIDFKRVHSSEFIYLELSLLPVIGYLIYLQVTFGSSFAFLGYESVWGKFLSLPWQAPFHSLGYLAANLFSIGEYPARVHLRFLIFLVACATLIFSIFRLRLSYSILFFSVMLISLSSGSLIDFPRYILIAFPLFIALGLIENELLQKILMVFSLSLLSLLSVLYFNSYFFM